MVTQSDNQVSVFAHKVFGEIRVLDQDGEPWFIAKDVCDALGTQTRDLRGILDSDEVSSCNVDSIHIAQSGGKNPLLISEAGLYSLVLRSRKPEAKAFKRWVTHEVLPAIRKTGHYSQPETFEEMAARCLTMAQARIEQMQAKIEDDAPKVEFHSRVTGADTVCQLGVACQVADLPIGRNTLFRLLREQGVLISVGERKNHPRQEYVDRGLFTVVENAYTDDDTGKTYVTFVTQVTQKGIEWLIKRFGGDGRKGAV